MKIALRIVLVLLTMWSIFDEDLNKPYAIIRHSIAFLFTYPSRVFFLLILVIACVFFVHRFYFKEQAALVKTSFNKIEVLLSAGEANNANVKTIQGTISYYRIIKELNEPLKSDSSFNFLMKEFIEKARRLYNYMPNDFKTKPEFRSSFFNFPTPCNFIYADNKYWKRRLLFFLKTDGSIDKFSATNYEFNGPIQLKDLRVITDLIPDDIFRNLINDHNRMILDNTDNGGEAIYRDLAGGYDYLIISVPLPAEKVNYNRILHLVTALPE